MADEGRRVIDLFCGAGGFSAGFHEHGFQPVWANDFNSEAADTYNENFGGVCSVGDIGAILDGPDFVVPQADLVVGGPPCQGFSLLNKNRATDPRKALWRQYMRVVRDSGAHAFVMENVPQLLGSAEYHDIRAEAERLGFKVVSFKLLAADFGVPQLRRRAFVVGCRAADPAEHFPPKPTHRDPKTEGLFADLEPWTTVKDAIGDLPPPEGTQIRSEAAPLDLHFGRNPTELSIKRYHAIPEEGMNRFDLLERAPELTPECWKRKKKGGTDLFGRLWWDRPSFTIRTEFYKPEKGRYLHPQQHRPLTHREAARLQSFPDDFRFVGRKIEIARQIGNAVPPRLASHIAAAVSEMLSESKVSC